MNGAFTKEQRPYKRYGAARTAWRSARREILLSGPAGTGKSRGLLEKVHFCADKYAGMRAIIVRKTRTSITQTAMVTYEQKVLPAGWLGEAVHWRTQEQQYEYPNGSVIAVGGMDKPTKIMSSEWDMIYVQEAIELFEADWEALTTRIRNGVMPYQQILADTNPSYPKHWLKRRCDRGDTWLLESRHEDNPSVTPAYIAALDALTGVRKLRLRYGKWAAADGMVYDDWDRDIHVASREQLIGWGILKADETINRDGVKHVIASVDWGFTNPGTIQVWAIDGDKRAFLIHEVYRTGQTIEWWIAQGQTLQGMYGIERFVCDPSEPAYIAQFCGAGLKAIKAENAIAPGISLVQARLKQAGDGRARLFLYEYALRERDEKREAAHEPYCVEQEIDGYVWAQSKDGQPVKELPVKINDHGCDALRYLVMYLDSPKQESGILIATDEETEIINATASWDEAAGAVDWW